MDSSVFPATGNKIKIPEALNFAKYLRRENDIFHQRFSAYANAVQNPDLLHIAIALTKRQKYTIRDCPLTFLNGSHIEASILCSKYAKNFGIMGEITILPSKNLTRNGEIQHNIQLEMSVNGPLVRYTLSLAQYLKNDLVDNVSAQLIASGSCGLAPSAKINQKFAVGAHLWAPFPFIETFRSHAFFGYGASPFQPSYTAGIGISAQFNERGRIDVGYCFKTGIQLGIGFDFI